MHQIRPLARLYTKTPKTEIVLKKWADVSGSKMCIRNYDQLQTRAQVSEGWPWIIILLVKPHFNKRVTDSHVFVLDLPSHQSKHNSRREKWTQKIAVHSEKTNNSMDPIQKLKKNVENIWVYNFKRNSGCSIFLKK